MLRSRLVNLLPANDTCCSRLDQNVLVSVRACRIPFTICHPLTSFFFCCYPRMQSYWASQPVAVLQLTFFPAFFWPDIICADYHHLALYPILLFLLVYLPGGPTWVSRENVLSGLALSVFVLLIFLAVMIFLSPRVYREPIEDA